MKLDAEAHAEEDKKKKELIDLKNQAESLIFTTEKTLTDAGDKVSADDRKAILDQVEDLKKSKDGTDIDLLKRNYESLSSAIQKVGASMYQQATANQAGDATQQTGGSTQEQTNEPIDAQYEEVNK